MKKSIKWHQECLANHLFSVQQEEMVLEDRRKHVERSRAEYEFAAYQLAEAIREGKDGYDADRYKVKKGKL